MVPRKSRPRCSSCQNLPPASLSPFPGPIPSRNPIPGLAPVYIPTPAPMPTQALSRAATNDLFKQFIKAYLGLNQEPRQPPAERKQTFKAKVLEMYYNKSHMDCYHFYQLCKGYLENLGSSGPSGPTRLSLKLFSFAETLVYGRCSISIAIEIRN